MQAELSSKEKIDALLAATIIRNRQTERHLAWQRAEREALKPRDFRMQREIGMVLYDHHLVFRALNQKSIHPAHWLLAAHAHYRVSHVSYPPLTQAEEIEVCHLLIRALGRRIVSMKDSMVDYKIPHYRNLLRAELVRLRVARDGRTFENAQDDFDYHQAAE